MWNFYFYARAACYTNNVGDELMQNYSVRWHPCIQSRYSEVVLVQTEPSASKLKALKAGTLALVRKTDANFTHFLIVKLEQQYARACPLRLAVSIVSDASTPSNGGK